MKKKMMETIQRHDMIQKGDNILIGVSGGPDSMALFSLLREISIEMSLTLLVAHVNHGVRGEAADKDEEYVKDICKKWGIPFYSKRVNMDEYAKIHGLTSEEAGRALRYGFFNEILKKKEGGKIAVAHNKGDQAETVLMRFIRGTGVDGLKGIEYKNGNIIRPLLDISREEIERYCETENLSPRIDKTNLEPIYGRNKIRLEMIPYIQDNFNEGIIDTLCRMANLMEVDGEYLNECAKRSYKEVLEQKTRYEIRLNIYKFLSLHNAIKGRVIRHALECLLGHLTGIEERHIRSIIELVSTKKVGKTIDMPYGLKVYISYEDFLIKKKDFYITKDYKVKLDMDKENLLHPIDAKITCKVFDINEIHTKSKHRFIKYFDYDKIKDGLYIRNRRSGDRIKPLGMNGTKKLKDFFIDQKIPKYLRDSIPIITDGDGIVWIVGYRIGDPYKIDENTKKILMVKYEGEDLNERRS
ncbi:tRNA lysidine(34) synthetase TilS [Clostridiisalibacter paucivorans]|uniref:tRNA lysidine(34) synthetase TilS n=1 Tax=Clostridiisalibacter paucivorans TaxID=408753 RepID=UPI00047BF926|nr:tRNA lysidine(34) synthetase TilS [Clostridiisalibacter paucivorans]